MPENIQKTRSNDRKTKLTFYNLFLQLRSLYEFQCLLERHIEETEFDIQDLEERLKISELDRFELQKLLEEGSQEVQDLEFKHADAQRELGKQTGALQVTHTSFFSLSLSRSVFIFCERGYFSRR